MQRIEKRDCNKIPVGAILKATTTIGHDVYGIVKDVSLRAYSVNFIMLGMSGGHRCPLYYKLHISNVLYFEILDIEELPLVFCCGYTTNILPKLLKGKTPHKILDELATDYLYEKSRKNGMI